MAILQVEHLRLTYQSEAGEVTEAFHALRCRE